MHAPTNLEIRCANTACDFTRDRPLPILTVDEPIYRRLPAFLIATVDKFAGLPWVGETGAFFGHVDRHRRWSGFYGAAEPSRGRPLDNGWSLDPPDLIIQDELHLISGPLGTVAGLYEAAIDQLAIREVRGHARSVPRSSRRPRRSGAPQTQIEALFDRQQTQHLPAARHRSHRQLLRPHGAVVDETRRGSISASPPRGAGRSWSSCARSRRLWRPRRRLMTPAPPASARPDNPADPYMTALCYFNALRELGGARRIVEDEVRDRARALRRQPAPRRSRRISPFADREHRASRWS